jgi:hypothetical protein
MNRARLCPLAEQEYPVVNRKALMLAQRLGPVRLQHHIQRHRVQRHRQFGQEAPGSSILRRLPCHVKRSHLVSTETLPCACHAAAVRDG